MARCSRFVSIHILPADSRDGGALTEAAAYTYARMSAEKQQQLLALFFGDGNHYNFCRLHIQSCDFALGNYAYVEDAKDTGLDSFSIERDRKYIIPFAKAALEKNSKIQFLASPWSPPAFMKTNGEMNHGGKLKKEYYQMWADMVARYVSAYRDEGITIQQLTVQNEPATLTRSDICPTILVVELALSQKEGKPMPGS